MQNILKSAGKISQVSAYQLFQVSRVAAVILISIILVKTGYATDEVSRYERFIFLANLFSFFWVMGIKNASLSYFPKLSEANKKVFFTQVFFLLQLVGLVMAILLFFTASLKTIGAGNFTDLKAKLTLSAYLILYAPTVLIEVIFILRKQSRQLVKYGLFFHSIQLLLIAVAAFSGSSIQTLYLLLLVWMGLKWAYALWLIGKFYGPILHFSLLRKYAWFALPLIGHMLLSNGMEFVDGLLVNRFFDPGAFAVFRYGARELPFVLILIGALSSTAIPLAVKNAGASAFSIKKHTRRLMHLFYPIALLLLVLSPYLFRFFYSDAYLLSARVFNIYLLILASRILLPEVFLYGKHQNRLLMYISFFELVINLLLSLVLLQYFGLEGIAAATVIAYLMSKVFMTVWIWRKYNIPPSNYIDLKAYLIYSTLLVSVFFIIS